MEEKGRQGFASMDPHRQKAIAGLGGRAAHQKGTAHEWTPEEARKASRVAWDRKKASAHPEGAVE